MPLQGRVGTLGYMAPEMFNSHHSYNEKVDIFSLGVLLFNLISGEMPFFGEDSIDVNDMLYYG